MRHIIRLSGILACIALWMSAGSLFVSCGDDKDEPTTAATAIIGSWYGTYSYYNPVGGTKYQYLTVRFNADMTGDLEYESPVSYSAAKFYYTISGTTVSCTGAWASSDGDLDTAFNMSFEYRGETLVPLDRYTTFILTRDGSIVTGSGNQGGVGDSGSGDSDITPGGGDNTPAGLYQVLTDIRYWSSSDGRYSFVFNPNGTVVYMEQSSTKIGSYGYPSLVASGSFTVSGSNISCSYTDVDWEYSGSYPNLFPGWKAGASCRKNYSGSVISSSLVSITTPDGRTIRLSAN